MTMYLERLQLEQWAAQKLQCILKPYNSTYDRFCLNRKKIERIQYHDGVQSRLTDSLPLSSDKLYKSQNKISFTFQMWKIQLCVGSNCIHTCVHTCKRMHVYTHTHYSYLNLIENIKLCPKVMKCMSQFQKDKRKFEQGFLLDKVSPTTH